MTYNITPFNIISLCFLLFGIFNFSFEQAQGGDQLNNFWPMVLIILAVVMIIIDYLLQRFNISYLKLCVVESILVIGLFLYAYFIDVINF